MKNTKIKANDINPSDPQKNIIPKTESDASEIISTEANYDRWSTFLFPHSRSPNIYGRRVKQWEAKLPNGKIAESKIEVIPAQDTKSYTTKTYDVFLALVAIWKERNMPEEAMSLFLSDIAKKLDLKPSGKTLNSILEELRCLEETKISWIFSFQTKNSTEETYTGQRVLNVFQYTKIKERSSDSISGRCLVNFSEHIKNNIKNQVTIPVNFTARKSIKSEIAKAIYNRVDSILAKINKHEKTAAAIITEYNMKASRYHYKSQRKVFLQLIKKYLDGIPLSSISGNMKVDIEETANKNDRKCVFTKSGRPPKKQTKNKPIENPDPEFRDYLVSEISSVVGGKDKNYRLYQMYALYYSENLIRRALGEYKELIKFSAIENKQGYFTAIMHTLCHKLGKDWIKPCDKNCKYRPENQLFPVD